MIYPKLSDGTIDWCAMCKRRSSDSYDLCCMCNYVTEDDPPSRYEPIAKRITNADRIRAMTDEELATFLFQSRIDKLSEREWLDWMKQEVSE